MENLTYFAQLGAAGLGFVLGWVLYLAIRGRKGNIDGGELTSIAAVVFGGAAAAYLQSDSSLFGAYGIGVFVGFVMLLTLTWRSLLATPGRSALEALERGSAPRTLTSVSPSRETAADDRRARGELERLAEEIERLLDLLIDARNRATGDQRRRLNEAIRTVTAYLRQIKLMLALDSLTSGPVSALIETLEEQSAALEEEADRLEQATNSIGQVNRTLGVLKSAIGAVRDLL